MTIAFTGTRRGMTPAQYERVGFVFRHLAASELSHGGCVGADREAHQIGGAMRIRVFPSNDEQRHWALLEARPTPISIEHVQDPLRRNKIMVDRNDVLVAAPAKMGELLRSGTWMTIRYARKMKRPVYICWPDGTVTEEKR